MSILCKKSGDWRLFKISVYRPEQNVSQPLVSTILSVTLVAFAVYFLMAENVKILNKEAK